MKAINLKPLSVDELLVLRDRVDTMLESRVDHERRELETRLKRLQRFKTVRAEPQKEKRAAKAPKQLGGKKSTKKVAPKYRNPENSSEAWSGRGLKPRWLTAAMKGSGKSIEYYRI